MKENGRMSDGGELVDLLKSMGMSVVAANELRSTSDKLDHLTRDY